MKIATWNVNSLKVRLPQVLQFLQESDIDILALQELKLAPEFFPHQSFEEIGYQAVWNGQKQYNGVAIISRMGIKEMRLDNPFYVDEHKRIIRATIGSIRIINIYAVNGEKVGSPKYEYKQAWFGGLIKLVENELKYYSELVLLGDFNIAPQDLDVYDPVAWCEKILCSSEERQYFQQLLALGLNDSLRKLDNTSSLYTWWDYRLNSFKRNLGLRIDHLLITENLLNRISDFGVAVDVRGKEQPSDHAPAWIKLNNI